MNPTQPNRFGSRHLLAESMLCLRDAAFMFWHIERPLLLKRYRAEIIATWKGASKSERAQTIAYILIPSTIVLAFWLVLIYARK